MANNVNLSFPSAYYQQFIDKNGKPFAGGKLYTYIAGSSTAIETYKKIGSVDATNTNTNPIILDMKGMANIVISRDMAYKFVLCDKNDVKIDEWDNITAGGSGGYLPETIVVRVDGTEHHITSTASRDGENRLIFTIDIDQDFLDRIDGIEEDIESLEQNKKDIVRQTSYTADGSSVKTIKKITQDPNGEVDVEFEDIEFPQQAPNVNITSPNNTIEIQSSTEGGVKTFEIDVKTSSNEGVWSLLPSTGWVEVRQGDSKYIFNGETQIDVGDIIERVFSNSTLRFKKDGLYSVFACIEVRPKVASNEIKNIEITFGSVPYKIPIDMSVVTPKAFTCYSFRTEQAGNSFYFNINNPDESIFEIKFNSISFLKIDGVTAQGGGGTEYEAGEAIEIENDEISVKYSDGLEVDEDNNLKVKIGNGLKFNEDSLEVEIDSDVEDVVEAVEKLTDDLDKKITTTYPFAQITMQGDFAGFGVTNTSRMIGQLFAVPIASEIRKNETMICINALQSFTGKVSFGIFEYDFEGNNGSGSTYWIADTGVVEVNAGENEYPLKYVDQDVHELQSSKLYYAVVAIAGDAPASGLFLAAAPNYAATYNANPKYTLLVSNMNQYIDWSTGTLQGAWFQGYNEDNTIPRLFMMLRNGDAVPPIPVTEPFTDIGAYTLEHINRVSNVFSLTPDANGGIFRKVIPQQDVDIVSFRYVDYHGSVNQNTSVPVLLDDTYTPIKQIADGSWTLGDSDQTKIDGTHYVHEFTFSTPVHLTANTAYWFLVGGNLSNQGNDWIINYQTPSVYNDLLLAKNLYNVNSWIVGNGNGEYQSNVRGMYLRLSDGTKTWVI